MDFEYYELKYLYDMLQIYGNKHRRNIRKNNLPENIIRDYEAKLRTNDIISSKLSAAINNYVAD